MREGWIDLHRAAQERDAGQTVGYLLEHNQTASGRKGPQYQERIIRELGQSVAGEHEHLRIDASTAATAVLRPGESRTREAIAAAGQRMEIHAAGVATGVPKRVMSRTPNRQLLGLLSHDAIARGGKLVAVEPAALKRR